MKAVQQADRKVRSVVSPETQPDRVHIDRRSFFRSLLGAGVAAHQLDLEKLLWVPGEKKIFIPPAPELPPPSLEDWIYVMRFPDPELIAAMNEAILEAMQFGTSTVVVEPGKKPKLLPNNRFMGQFPPCSGYRSRSNGQPRDRWRRAWRMKKTSHP